MHPPVIYSIVSANYLAYARTLMQSVREHHPESRRYVFLADEDPGDLDLDSTEFTSVPARALTLPNHDHFAFRYSILEFNTAIKPFAARWLAERHPEATIVYLDPDIFVVSPLRLVLDATATGALAVLTPHLTAPLTDDKRPDELSIMRVGAYNLGFIAFGPHEKRPAFMDWWAEKLERSAHVDLESGLFTDQKWIDLVPGLFPDVTILRNPGYNLAYWNLPHRHVTRVDGRWLANGEPIAFAHFSGVSVRNPDAFSMHQNRYDINGIGELRGLYEQYVARLRDNGYDRFIGIPYAYARLRDGTVITQEMRDIFRHRFDTGRSDATTDPFGVSAAVFDEDVSLAGRAARLGLRAHARLRTRRPVRFVMDRLSVQARWALRRVVVRTSTPPSVRAAQEEARRARLAYPTSRPTGLESEQAVNVIGYLTGEFGVAEAARGLIRAAEAGGTKTALIGVPAAETARSGDTRLAGSIGTAAPHLINILCVNADQTEFVMNALGPRVIEGRYNVGYWFWELARFPEAWQGAMDRVDEIWVASDFVRAAVAQATTKPVRNVRMAVDATPTRPYARSEFALRDGPFSFLFSFDFGSFGARKNPTAVVDAFRRAFPTGDEDVMLVIKSTNSAKARDENRALLEMVAADPRVRMIDGFMSRDEVYGLQSVVDSYVSLHRSEGFGLGLAESMSLGKPVIGTAYSGNMEFMDASTSCPVGYRLVDVPGGAYPYGEGQVWADPDIDQAAYFMRRLAEDRTYGADLGRRASAHIRREFSAEAVGAGIAGDISRILRRLED